MVQKESMIFNMKQWLWKLFPGREGQMISFLCCCINGLIVLFFIFPFFASKYVLPVIPPEYIQMIRDLFLGNGLRWEWPNMRFFMMAKEPGYPLFLAMFYALLGKFNTLPIQLTQIFLNGLICWLVWMITFESTKKMNIATLASMSYAFHPLPIWYSVRIWNDIPTSLLLIVSVWLFLFTLHKRSFFYASLTGLCLGISTLFRVISVSLLLIFIGFMLFLEIKQYSLTISEENSEPKKIHFFKQVFIIIFVFILTISPWVFRNILISGQPVLLTIQGWGSMIDGGEIVRMWKLGDNIYRYDGEQKKKTLVSNFYYQELQNNPEKYPGEIELIVNNRLKQTALNEIKKEPLRFIKKIFMNLFFFWYLGTQKIMSTLLMLLNIILLPLALIGTALSIKEHNYFLTTFAVIIFCFCVLQAFVVGYSRYSVPVLPYVISLAAFAYNKFSWRCKI